MTKETYEWAELEGSKDVIVENDVRHVHLPVNVLFKWSDWIIGDMDEEGNILEYKSGWVMEVLPQKIVYQNEPTTYLYNVFNDTRPEQKYRIGHDPYIKMTWWRRILRWFGKEYGSTTITKIK